ncbi:hypothetical protein EVAR_64552_1 [Eumeta japonica]|uniref:Reverse transcriptase domain-containing protein n=1 Tax=Eumeta variegata TaxID=151549 RepID=A0A4C1ZRN4_EUMVA|nr:hypothetical protein EVAR_64552_1 [Eumeta japonica]
MEPRRHAVPAVKKNAISKADTQTRCCVHFSGANASVHQCSVLTGVEKGPLSTRTFVYNRNDKFRKIFCRAESRLSTARSDKAYNDFNVTAMPTRSCYNAIDPRFSRDGCSKSFPWLVPGNSIESKGSKYPYRGVGSSRLDCSDDGHHPPHLVHRRGETRTKEVRFGNLHVCEGMDDKINDDWELMKDRRPGILCVNHTNRTDSGDAIEHGLSETYCSGVDQREQRYRDLGFILSDGLSESVKGYLCVNPRLLWLQVKIVMTLIFILDLYATDMSNPLEEQEEFWADVKTYNFNIRETKRSSCYTILIVEWVYKDWFDICKAVKQGCVASPWLFSLPMNGCLHNPKECEYELRMVKLSVKCFLYADDQVILALSACDLPKVATKMNDPVKKRVHWSPEWKPVDFFVWVSLKWPVYDSEEIMSEDHLIPKVNDAAEKLRTEIRLGITTGEVRRKERARA